MLLLLWIGLSLISLGGLISTSDNIGEPGVFAFFAIIGLSGFAMIASSIPLI